MTSELPIVRHQFRTSEMFCPQRSILRNAVSGDATTCYLYIIDQLLFLSLHSVPYLPHDSLSVKTARVSPPI